MKASIHLFYGIIIGVLICACTGGTSNTATPTSSIADQKSFKEIKLMCKKDVPESVWAEKYRPYGKGYYSNENQMLAWLVDEGWTIIDTITPPKAATDEYRIGAFFLVGR